MADNDTAATSGHAEVPEAVLEQREVLRAAMLGVEEALAAPSVRRRSAWCSGVAAAARTLDAAFTAHIEVTEGVEGLYADLQHAAPRLERRIGHLRSDHVEIRSYLDSFLVSLDAGAAEEVELESDDVTSWRDDGNRILGQLMRHRQLGIELTHEAYTSEFGGE